MIKYIQNINFRVFITVAKFAKINRTRTFPVLLEGAHGSDRVCISIESDIPWS